jgi:hypothetical protein
MATHQILQWRDGRGWLVLAGGPNDDVRAAALARMAADGVVAYVALGGGTAGQRTPAEHVQDDMQDLGAPTGYIVDVLAEDDETLTSRLTDAALVVISGGHDAHAVRNGLQGAALAGLQTAFANGAVMLLEGAAAAAFGSGLLTNDGELSEHAGFDWLQHSMILPAVTSVQDTPSAKRALQTQPERLIVGLGTDSALALGPDGQVEVWGGQVVTIALGVQYAQRKNAP